jgi:Lysine methyltransferase
MDEEQFDLPIDAGILHGHRGGSGAPALLLHGGPAVPDDMGECAALLDGLFSTIRYMQRGVDAIEFRRASHAVWEAMAPGWDNRHAYFEETARPVTERMLERLVPALGETILELAAGTGVAGFAAAAFVGPGGRVIVSDFSRAMVEAAERPCGRART